MRLASVLTLALALAASGAPARAGSGPKGGGGKGDSGGHTGGGNASGGWSPGSHGGGGNGGHALLEMPSGGGGGGYMPSTPSPVNAQQTPGELSTAAGSLGGPAALPADLVNPGATPEQAAMGTVKSGDARAVAKAVAEGEDPSREPDEKPRAPVSLDDARDNFEAVVRAHVAKGSEDGVWTWRQPGGRALKLEFVSADADSVRAAGKAVYAGAVSFRDRERKPVTLEFSVDFAGPKWKVIGIRRPAPEAPAAKKAGTTGA